MVFRRVFHADTQTYSFPAASPDRARFISDFYKMAVANYTAQQFAVWPYATVLSYLAKDSILGKSGIDLFWMQSVRFQLSSTLNTDFGQVEIHADGIHRIVFTDESTSGGNVDNLMFNSPAVP